ncbi:MAG: quinolinate synthase NadA [Mariprofundaceae bacterium]
MNALPMLQMLYKRPEGEILDRIRELRADLDSQLLILVHHYQREEVYAFADITGDSLKLAREAARTEAPFIIFCGVHFMAETADILTSDQQAVILPDPAAGCSMADMADLPQVNQAWKEIGSIIDVETTVTPVTYINSTASLKAFCGRHGGIVCTSSNARNILEWSWDRRSKILFFPDQHLGRNTALRMGLNDEDMIVWKPGLPLGGNTSESIHKAQLILWHGCCSVHMLFQAKDIINMRQQHPDIEILAHPECSREVCDHADMVGSTESIIRHVEAAPSGQSFAIGTELNLVNRLRLRFPDKPVFFLSPTVCMCSTMFRTDPQHLCASLEGLADNRVENKIKVPSEEKYYAKIALERMLGLV